MKAGRKRQILTDKEAELMNMLWDHGPLFVREMVERYPEPRPHFNTVATLVRILEGKGYVSHEAVGGSHRFTAVADKADFRDRSLAELIRNYFDNSYKRVVSALADEEKITADDLREIIALMEKKNSENKAHPSGGESGQ
ncbi:MAG: BlaI/MecI/CopY family transcriptional regulator [Muribaculaceae bacterium]|nr:BlaI/MecI/CopY family transcriptional regulator [Muribaculaceae bacterium]MDE6135355.1 BlaI/MecI/CopY family transcriptional regulator [Muribaculaceae bacterium]